MTITFVDLVDYTPLSERFDPEDVIVVVRRFQNLSLQVMERFGGFVARYLGDGILVYFGYPIAHENDAERALRASLELLERLKTLDTTSENSSMPPLQARIGINSGLVLVAPQTMSTGTADYSAFGGPVNLAARLQAEAPPGGVVVSGDTRDLVERQFEFKALGDRPIKGLSRKVPVYQVIRPIPGARRAATQPYRGAARMVDREIPLAQLISRWRIARNERRCQIVAVAGEAGVGKTRLLLELCGLAEVADASIVQASCHEIFASTPLYPVASLLWARAALTAGDDEAARFRKISTLLSELRLDRGENREIVASLVGLATSRAMEAIGPTPLLFKRKQYDLVAAVVAEIVRRRPTILWIEDVHWLDPSTAELLLEIVAAQENSPLLVIVTMRSFPTAPALPAADELVSLEQMEGHDCLQIARSIPGAQLLPEEIVSRAVASAEGVPLFIEQFMVSLIEEARQSTPTAHGRSGLPLVLAEMISGRLDRRPEARQIARAAACIGRSFTIDFLALLLGKDQASVEPLLQWLIEAEILLPKRFGAEIRYEFRHALLQRLAYESVVQSERRALHERIVQILQGYDEFNQTPPEVVAHHFTEAGKHREAIEWWLRAGMNASQLSAHVEAIDHLRKGLGLLDKIPEEARRREFELKLQATMIGSLIATEGATSTRVSECCQRGLQLCHQGERSPLIFPFAFGQFTFTNCRGQVDEAHELAQLFLRLAEEGCNESGRVVGHRMLATMLFGQGDAVGAKQQCELSMSLYSPERDEATTHLFGQNTEVHTRSLLSLVLFCLGEIDRSLEIGVSALRSADALRHPHSTAIPLTYVGGWVFGLCEAADHLMKEAERLIALAERHGLGAFRAHGMAHLGWALCQSGRLKQGAESIEQAIAGLDSINFALSVSGYLALWADAQRRLGNLTAAEAACTRAIGLMRESSFRWLEPEFRRIEALVAGELSHDPGKAQEMLGRAVSIARSLGFPTLERRCLISLAAQCMGDDRRDSGIRRRLQELSYLDDLPHRVAKAMEA